MEDQPHHSQDRAISGGNRHVEDVANQALSHVANRPGKTFGNRYAGSSETLVSRLHTAALDDDSTAFDREVDDAIEAGATVERMCETYIPEVARILGNQWCEDQLGFAGVTIGCARLTATLRRLENRNAPPEDAMAPQILVLVAQEVYHTLGATVLCGILRRAGYGVQLWTGADPALVAAHLRQSDFDAVFVSASMGETLESVRLLVSTAKAEKPDLLTFVGGTIIDTVGDPEQVRTLTGADYATKDPNEAITLCDSTIRQTRTPTTRLPRTTLRIGED